MRRISWILCLLILPGVLLAHGNKPGKATLKVGDGAIEIVYTAPELKGRDINELIKTEGANPWGMGADRATKLQTPVALQIGDATLPAGEYTLRAYLDDDGHWWLQFVDDGRAVVGKLMLDLSTASEHLEYLVIGLSGSASNGALKIQWGKFLLSGSFSAE